MPASTISDYLAELSAERRAALNAVREGINRVLPTGYEEGFQFGMISWFVPLSVYPAGYGGNRKQPLPLISLASQKSHMALHMICFYGQPALLEWFHTQYANSGKKLDMGKGCLRFKALPDLALDVVEGALARLPVSDYAAGYQAMRDAMGKGCDLAAARSRAPTRKTPAGATRGPHNEPILVEPTEPTP